MINDAQDPVSSPPPPAITGLEIVPWKLVPQALALQLLPLIIDSQRAARSHQVGNPVIILRDAQNSQLEGGPSDSGPDKFEFQSQEA